MFRAIHMQLDFQLSLHLLGRNDSGCPRFQLTRQTGWISSKCPSGRIRPKTRHFRLWSGANEFLTNCGPGQFLGAVASSTLGPLPCNFDRP